MGIDGPARGYIGAIPHDSGGTHTLEPRRTENLREKELVHNASVSEILGSRLRACRVEARMNPQQTAEHIGMRATNAGQTIAKWERGKTTPPLERLEAYAAAFHKELDWFFTAGSSLEHKRSVPKNHELEHLDEENGRRVLARFLELTWKASAS